MNKLALGLGLTLIAIALSGCSKELEGQLVQLMDNRHNGEGDGAGALANSSITVM